MRAHVQSSSTEDEVSKTGHVLLYLVGLGQVASGVRAGWRGRQWIDGGVSVIIASC